MSEHRQIPEPGELIYTPQSSWAPVFFAAGALGLVGGIYAAGFIFSPFIYSIVGAVLILAAFRSLVRGGIRGYYRLPRKQRVRSAALPVETITPPKRP
jgi:predicted PurR-regulated permease PerM